MTKLAVFDLDGVLFDPTVRKTIYEIAHSVTPERADKRYEIGHYLKYDKVIPNALATVIAYKTKGYEIAYLSGRRESATDATLRILDENEFPEGRLHLKPRKGDSTEDFKGEVLQGLLNQFDEVIFFDDAESNRAVGELLGIQCYESCEAASIE